MPLHDYHNNLWVGANYDLYKTYDYIIVDSMLVQRLKPNIEPTLIELSFQMFIRLSHAC